MSDWPPPISRDRIAEMAMCLAAMHPDDRAAWCQQFVGVMRDTANELLIDLQHNERKYRE